MSPSLASASGVRPVSAFVVIAIVLSAVCARVGWLCLFGERPDERPLFAREGGTPSHEITDRDGRLLAVSLARYDLAVSPRSLWQVHTPERIAARIFDALERHGAREAPRSPGELLARMLPEGFDPRTGDLAVEGLAVDPATARSLTEWIEDEAPPGFRLERARGGAPAFRLVWRPLEVLAEGTRRAAGAASAWSWTRRVGSSLATALFGAPGPSPDPAAAEVERLEAVWSLLLGDPYEEVVEGVAPGAVLEVLEICREESVQRHQLWFETEDERAHPAGELGVLGRWAYASPEDREPRPIDGLERLAESLVLSVEGSLAPRAPARHAWLLNVAQGAAPRPYLLDARFRTPPPRIRTTLDLPLQREVRRRLERCFGEHRPAVAMAIVAEVASGRVLAVDAISEYPSAAFPPTFHLVTPGSIFKPITMSVALDAGVVRPEEVFDVGHGEYVLRLEEGGRASSRRIHEAEGHAVGRITAAECLAQSSNAGLVQIGTRIPDEVFRGRLAELGFGRVAESGLGGERPGWLPPLPWKRVWTHASVSFGHEISATLWQHATAMATLLRGGVHRPLQLVEGLEQGGERWVVAAGSERRVLAEGACEDVRAMLRRAARHGTGEPVFREGLALGTKTGTTDKVPTEVCLHVEGRARLAADEAGRTFTAADYRALRGRREDHAKCYTSSMCAFGRLPEGSPEVMVLVVVDEPRGREKFGARVAGPTAVAILEEALGVTRGGEPPERPALEGFFASVSTVTNDRDRPWAPTIEGAPRAREER